MSSSPINTSTLNSSAMDDIQIADEDFDRLWDQAVAEAFLKSFRPKRNDRRLSKHRHSDAPGALPSDSKQGSSRRYSSAEVHEQGQQIMGDHESARRRSSESNLEPQNSTITKVPSMPSLNGASKDTKHRQFSPESKGRFGRRSSDSNDVLRRSYTRSPSMPALNKPFQRKFSSKSSELRGSFRRSASESSKSNVRFRRQFSRSSSESSRDEMNSRRSSLSRVPSMPSLHEVKTPKVHRRESKKYTTDDSSLSSLGSGFSGFDSVSIHDQQPQRSRVSEIRWKHSNNTRLNGRNPAPGQKKLESEEFVQRGVASYVLKADSFEEQQLQFLIPTAYRVKGYKENHNQSTGLVLAFGKENDTGTVIIKGISPTSLFSNSQLKSGDELLMINSHRVKSPQQAAKIMKSISGDVTLFMSEGSRPPGVKYVRVKTDSKRLSGSATSTEVIDSNLRSASKDLILGTRNNGLVRVSYVNPLGIFRKSLSVGDIVFAVNGRILREDVDAEKCLLEPICDGVICLLIYSMADLCKGLISQLLPDWKSVWVSEVEVTLLRDNVSFSIVWSDDWVCECTPSNEVVYNSEVKPRLGEINWAMTSVINSILQASGAKDDQNIVDYNSSLATSDSLIDDCTDKNSKAGNTNDSSSVDPKLKESQQITAPTIEADTDDDVTQESEREPIENAQETS